MPELPEVETMRLGILAIVGSRVADLWSPPSELCPITMEPPVDEVRRAVVGRKIVSVGRAGKRVVLEFEGGRRMVIEPRMTGRVLLQESFDTFPSLGSAAGRRANPPDIAHLRLVLRLRGHPARQVLFWDSRGLGVIRLLSPEAFQQVVAALGPDARDVTAAVLRERLSSSRRAVKVALLDQRAVAGIGNLYASEILHRARLHPELRCNCLRTGDWRRLDACIREVLEEAILHQGSTLGDGMYRTAENESGHFQNHHRVYQRAGQPCSTCGKSPIVRIVQAQRSTFFCPTCQRCR
jgi:formamidopyrimidine-DNA glycosylase